MTSQELATVAQLDLPLIVIVANNGALGTIKDAQLARSPQRLVATTLVNPDFVALARSYGFKACKVSATSQFAGILEKALALDTPALIELDLTQ